MEIKTFGIIGAGQMGGGIAQVVAMSGLDVVMNDIKSEFVEKGLEWRGFVGFFYYYTAEVLKIGGMIVELNLEA